MAKTTGTNLYFNISDEDNRINMMLAGLIGWRFELEDEEVLGKFTVTKPDGEQVKLSPKKVFGLSDMGGILPTYTHDLNAIWDVYRGLHRSSKPPFNDMNKFTALTSSEMARKMTVDLIAFFENFVHRKYNLDAVLGKPETKDTKEVKK